MQNDFSTDDYLAAVREHGSISAAARALGVDRRGFQRRLNRAGTSAPAAELPRSSAVVSLDVRDGSVLIGSDAHYHPALGASSAHRALVRQSFADDVRAVILNGDIIDAPTASSHPSICWEHRPTLAEEIEVAKKRLGEINNVPRRIWPLGNHDARFETRLAKVAPEYAGIEGVHLKDHFEYWEPCWSVVINGELVVKHRWAGAQHAAYQNVLKSGLSIATGHTHRLLVTPFTDWRGRRYGIETGTLAHQPDLFNAGPQFEAYTECNPLNWQSGFVVLTFRDGKLLPPELATTIDEQRGHVAFRGEIMEV